MRLTKLELTGFKSFADTVTLHFEDGVTAIVGPNGCGKSNVSDAMRWVLGAQSARLLRGAKMEDVIFQGAATRRPINLTEVSLYLDNSSGDLPIAYQEVQITRRLSRSGQSDYLLNKSPVRLRDIYDLLRGTGLGSDAGVVIEAKMIDLLLSDRAGERRSLFEEAAGIGLYRDRKHSTERRLEETGVDLQRVEDLIGEVQSQIRSLARQRGKAERHAKLLEEKFAVDVTLAHRQLHHMGHAASDIETRHQELSALLPESRAALRNAQQRLEQCAAVRTTRETQRTDIARRLSAVKLTLGKLDGDLALAAERLTHGAEQHERLLEQRHQMETRAQQADRDRETAGQSLRDAQGEYERIQRELAARSQAEEAVRERLAEQRGAVRALEEQLHRRAQTHRSFEGERAALEEDLAALREQSAQAASHHTATRAELDAVVARRDLAETEASKLVEAASQAAAEADRCRHLLAESREREALARADRRRAEEVLAQLTARRQALEELERERVGLAPSAAALLKARNRFDGQVLGPLSDYVRASREDAKLAERLLGEWMHAVLIRDASAVTAIREWHAASKSGTLVLLPANQAPRSIPGRQPLENRLHIDDPNAARWVEAILRDAQVLDTSGNMVRHQTGAIVLAPGTGPTGPLQRRAELEALSKETGAAETTLARAAEAVEQALRRIGTDEQALALATAATAEARESERVALAAREDGVRRANGLEREVHQAAARAARLEERLQHAERRLLEVDDALTSGEIAKAREEEELGTARVRLAELETELEAAREDRVHWQVQMAHVDARRRASQDAVDRSTQVGTDAAQSATTIAEELATIADETNRTRRQQGEWQDQRAEARIALLELEAAAADGETAFAEADHALQAAEKGVATTRERVEALSDEFHQLELRVTELAAERRRITERIEMEWKRPLDLLTAESELLELDLGTLEAESTRIRDALEKTGPVNPLAVEEHAEEVKRLEFLQSQRDDLVAARRSLLQAIREIDTTARAMLMETFAAVQENFSAVFQTLFGGGECSLRLADPDDPLESEIEIHAAPRGKRTQRIHLLSSGERTLVAVSLLFSIYLTKPSPFCLMDEVDAPLDDANVGRFTRLLDEFKQDTQFIVITHNPRTMQAADAVYGVTMQEPGVSTVVGVRLGERQLAGAGS